VLGSKDKGEVEVEVEVEVKVEVQVQVEVEVENRSVKQRYFGVMIHVKVKKLHVTLISYL
jgi:hypothetical protein